MVLDTSVVASAFRSRRGASWLVLSLVAARRLVPLATTALFLEYEDVLKRPEQRMASGLSAEQVDAALSALAAAIEPVEVHFTWRPVAADPADDMVMEAAINGRADALVTHNVRDFAAVAPRFGIPVLTPGVLWERMRA